MHEGWLALGIVLRQREGWAGDWFADATGHGQALHQGGLACSEGTLQQQDRALGQALCQLPPQGASGLKGLKFPDTLCRVRAWRARSLGVSAEIHIQIPQGALRHGGSAHNRA